MYSYLFHRFGSRAAYWLTASWYAGLIVLVLLCIPVPAAEFRYGQI